MKDQGTSPEEVKLQIANQLAEGAVLALKLGVKDDDLHKAYDSARDKIGLPERVQLRVIAVPAASKEAGEVQKLLNSKSDFQQVAQQYNLPNLRAIGGMLGQLAINNPDVAIWRNQIKQTAEGAFFGPVAMPGPSGQPPVKAWVKVEKKLPAFLLPFDDAKNLIRQTLIQQKLMDPKNASVRLYFVKLKQDAAFQATDPKYQIVWDGIKIAGKAATAPAVAASGGPGGNPSLPMPGGK